MSRPTITASSGSNSASTVTADASSSGAHWASHSTSSARWQSTRDVVRVEQAEQVDGAGGPQAGVRQVAEELPPFGGPGHDGQVVAELVQWAASICHGAIAPEGVPQRRHQSRPQRVPIEKFLDDVFPGHGVGTPLGTSGELAGTLREASASRAGELVGLGVAVAPTGVTPLAVVVEVVVCVASDVVGPGPAQRREGGREAQALGRELPGVAEGVGVGPQAQVPEVLRSPRLQAVRTMATMWGRRSSRSICAAERIGWASHAVPSAVLVAYLAT